MLKQLIPALLLILGAPAGSAAQTPFRGPETRVAVAQDANPPPSEDLARLSPAKRQAGRVDLKLVDDSRPGVLTRKWTFERLWQAGRYEDAWVILRALENEGLVAGVAENCGGPGIRVEEAEELDAAMKKALAHDGFSLVEVMADPLLVESCLFTPPAGSPPDGVNTEP